MYFQIENTPENIKRARKKDKVREVHQEECPRLILAPFTKPPQVVFENVTIGSTCEKELEVLNPCKDAQQITLGKSLPPGLIIHLPRECLEVEPETCYCVTMAWTPTQPTSVRETIRFVNANRGRYDVIVVMKSVVPAKGKSTQRKLKTSPGKITKKTTKKSPVAICKKKMEAVCTTTVKNTINVLQSTQYKIVNPSYKENKNPRNDYSIEDSTYHKCPFGSPSSLDFNTSEIFSNMLRPKAILHETYDKYCTSSKCDDKLPPVPTNILKPSNKQACDTSASDVFDNLNFTPLKSIPSKNDKLDKGPKIIISVNSESDFEDSVDIKTGNKENETHSVICVTSSAYPTKWLTGDPTHNAPCIETPVMNKKIPNTSSPKDLSPNFSINTDFSRISDLSFFPPRFSTERKILPKINNETHDIVDDSNINLKLNSDTYTKESPNTPLDYRINKMCSEFRHLPSFGKEAHPKLCRQSLFKEPHQYRESNVKNYYSPDLYPWHSDLRADVRSPPRSLTPPLQSIPEESVQISETQVLDKLAKQTETFTIDQTFDRPGDLSAISLNRQSTWSKRAVRSEHSLWKTPAPVQKKPTKPKESIQRKESLHKANLTLERNTSVNHSNYLNYVGNVYSQSLTVDPFLSSTYYYDKEAVDNIEKEFKRWLNCVLTPPADLDSNIEQKIDVGKAWIENRNKEVPLAPTKEQVCSTYHNSHRLESLRRSARALLRSPEMNQVFAKLQVQIEKKLIAIRNDKNLHLDIGLQKIIMEILLSYNPLWLRIGLEAIYGQVLPLKSNNDIEGLTTFIIQRMFKNPNLKNKHSKSSAPNMLLPAYIEAIKKFTLKKFFSLVFFLDQAKQKKLIPHDPCLFRRNAPYKESKEIIINFTKELIAGIGDITRHLRPLGYVVSHKQSYLDEYIYAVHNIAVDIRDGVRLTKVMEIILMRKGLLHQMRTPAISRLQKIHNVQVALNALKEANFTIAGDIGAADIADGHREKTLSLLWQIIHVFRAPLFEQAATVIQAWWRKKYVIILEKKREEERWLKKQNTAASIIQHWWQLLQYNRMVEQQMQKITEATIIFQKYCRMWLCRTRLKKMKSSVLKISNFYKNAKFKRQVVEALQILRSTREELRCKAATTLQAHFRRKLCVRQFRDMKTKVILVQSVIRRYLALKQYKSLKKTVLFVELKYKGKLLMRKEMQNLALTRNRIIRIQNYYRMLKVRRYFKELKRSVITVEKYYTALMLMRTERTYYLKLKWATSILKASYRRNKVRKDYLNQRYIIVKLQTKVRALQTMKKDRANFMKIRCATVVIQKHVRAYRAMKVEKARYIAQRNCAILIQRHYRAYLQKKTQRSNYLLLRKSVIRVQSWYRSLLAMRQEKFAYSKLRNSALLVQRRYKATILMRESQNKYQELKKAALVLQRRYRALLKMREEKVRYTKLKYSCIVIQNAYRANVKGKLQRKIYLTLKESAIKIQGWYRSVKKTQEVKHQFLQTRKACVTIQKKYRAYIVGKKQRQEFIHIKTASMCIQRYYRNYLLTKSVRKDFLKVKKSTVLIQKFLRTWTETKRQRQTYLKIRQATITIQVCYRQYRVAKMTRLVYRSLKLATICIQQRYRCIVAMRKDRETYINLKRCTINVQRRFRALLEMHKQRQIYQKQRSAIITLQQRLKAVCIMKRERSRYLRLLQACNTIQSHYRAYRKGVEQRNEYLSLRNASIRIQRSFRALMAMREVRRSYLQIRAAAIVIQRQFRARQMMLQEKATFTRTVGSCVTIQRFYRARLVGMKQREAYVTMKTAAILIQNRWRTYRLMKTVHESYCRLRTVTISVQRLIRAKNEARLMAKKMAVDKIQTWYLSIKQRNLCRSNYIYIRTKIVVLQSNLRMYMCRKRYLAKRNSALTLQRHYRSYMLAKSDRQTYTRVRSFIIKLQAHVRRIIQRKRYLRIRAAVVTLQVAFRFQKRRALLQKRREGAAVCIQKYVRRHLAQSQYKAFREKLILVQTLWRSKLIARVIRCEFLQKKAMIIKLQASIRGYLVRKEFESKKENMLKLRKKQKEYWAASMIQALFRGHMVRVGTVAGLRAAELRRRWRRGVLHSAQSLTLRERNEDALDVLFNMSDIESVILAFQSLELLTEVMPMMYETNAARVSRKVHTYMSAMNRSISSVEVLNYGAAILVNLTRYRITGPSVYSRDRINETLKYMWRFSNTETRLFCTLCTYIWLFSKYDAIKKDLAEFLRTPENHKMLVTIKGNVMRMKKMQRNTRKSLNTSHSSKLVSHYRNINDRNQSLRTDSANLSICSTSSNSPELPAKEPDYGIARVDRPRYFTDAQQAINALFHVYML